MDKVEPHCPAGRRVLTRAGLPHTGTAAIPGARALPGAPSAPRPRPTAGAPPPRGRLRAPNRPGAAHEHDLHTIGHLGSHTRVVKYASCWTSSVATGARVGRPSPPGSRSSGADEHVAPGTSPCTRRRTTRSPWLQRVPRSRTRTHSGPNRNASTARTLNRYPATRARANPPDASGTWRAICLAANTSQCLSCAAGGAGCTALDAVSSR